MVCTSSSSTTTVETQSSSEWHTIIGFIAFITSSSFKLNLNVWNKRIVSIPPSQSTLCKLIERRMAAIANRPRARPNQWEIKIKCNKIGMILYEWFDEWKESEHSSTNNDRRTRFYIRIVGYFHNECSVSSIDSNRLPLRKVIYGFVCVYNI